MQCPKCNHPLGMKQVARKDKPDRLLYKCRNYKCQHTLTYDNDGNRLSRKHLSDDEIKQLYALSDDGMTIKKIADMIGCSMRTVSRRMSEREAMIVNQYNEKIKQRLQENYGKP